MIMTRKWAMPSANTFSIPPIKDIINKYIHLSNAKVIVDPFANSSKIGTITNDLDPQYDTDYHMDALEFLKMLPTNNAAICLNDPPYSPQQVVECYTKLNKTVDAQSTNAQFWTKLKSEIARITKVGGYALSFGWNSGGIGKNNGFEIVEILLVAHGGMHHDTIVTVERKIQDRLFF